MKFAYLAISTIAVVATSASAAGPQYRGKCARQAERAAYQELVKMDLGPEGDSVTMSSKEHSEGSDEYTVVFAIYDGNESSGVKYTVTFGELSGCKKPAVVQSN